MSFPLPHAQVLTRYCIAGRAAGQGKRVLSAARGTAEAHWYAPHGNAAAAKLRLPSRSDAATLQRRIGVMQAVAQRERQPQWTGHGSASHRSVQQGSVQQGSMQPRGAHQRSTSASVERPSSARSRASLRENSMSKKATAAAPLRPRAPSAPPARNVPHRPAVTTVELDVSRESLGSQGLPRAQRRALDARLIEDVRSKLARLRRAAHKLVVSDQPASALPPAAASPPPAVAAGARASRSGSASSESVDDVYRRVFG